MQDHVRIHSVEVLSDDWHILRKTTFDYRRRDGRWQTLSRETYDRGDGATILLYNRAQRTVLLTRQFRFPAFVNGHNGFLIETAAGMLDNASPEQRIRAEAEEETGYAVQQVEKIMEVFMSPGSVTERVHFFIGEYDADGRIGAGGGLEAEGEDIEILELNIDTAMAMVASGEIMDAKTIMLLQYLQLQRLTPRSMMILIAGPCRSGADGDPAKIAANLAAMEACAGPLYQLGHMPVLVEWLALPLVQASGGDSLLHPHCERLLEHCDAVLRIGGPSAGAERMATLAGQRGLPVYRALADIPPALAQ
jgi:nudix-type nucleoside diphosphatase (YffH/AdpP family)